MKTETTTATAYDLFKHVCDAARVPVGEARLGVLLRMPENVQVEVCRSVAERLRENEQPERGS